MPIKTFKTSIFLSVLFHAALFALVIWGASLFYAVKFETPGETEAVGVWLAAGGETIGDGHKRLPPASIKPETKMAAETTGKSSHDEGGSSSSSSGSGGSFGGGEGKGSTGKGNPILATIWKKINASKYYPNQAKRLGMKGDPQVVFQIAESGEARDIKISRTSGKTLLDDAAIETVKRAAPLPYFAGPITVTIKYSLKE